MSNAFMLIFVTAVHNGQCPIYCEFSASFQDPFKREPLCCASRRGITVFSDIFVLHVCVKIISVAIKIHCTFDL